MVRVVQITDGSTRRVALVDEPHLRVLDTAVVGRGSGHLFDSVHTLAQAAMASDLPLSTLVGNAARGQQIEYDDVYEGRSAWRLLPPIDHPEEPARCLVTGTGLTHIGSARNRSAMHDSTKVETLTDSMRMFQAGLDGGRPEPEKIGVAPEWFYKGTGSVLRAHGDPLIVPPYAEDGGEEAEIAGIYVIDPSGQPRRVGMAIGNEFSDHRYERRNYLHLAGSKLRTCALGPELVLDPAFDTVPGEAWIERGDARVWSKSIASGEAEMSHSLRNIEHHHFKYEGHRRPGDVHVHYFGAHSLSFGDGVALADGDVMVIRFDGFGRALRNPLCIERPGEQLVTAPSLR
jgi:hypothetical protein